MKYYVFKLNLQWSVLKNYTKEEDKKYLLEVEIPRAFESVFEISKTKTADLYRLNPTPPKTDDFSRIFDELDKLTNELISHYNDVLVVYKEKNQIFYSTEFLKINKKCMDKRNYLQKKYPGIVEAFSVVPDSIIESDYGIELDKQVGTGIQHIKKFLKIKYFLSTDLGKQYLEPLNLRSFYNSKNEQILVESENEDAALYYVQSLMSLLNNDTNFDKIIGNVSLIPIYDSIAITANLKKISYTIVYPNGRASAERHRALIEMAEAKELMTTISAEEGRYLSSEPIEKELKDQAEKGYLKSVDSKYVKKVIKFITTINI